MSDSDDSFTWGRVSNDDDSSSSSSEDCKSNKMISNNKDDKKTKTVKRKFSDDETEQPKAKKVKIERNSSDSDEDKYLQMKVKQEKNPDNITPKLEKKHKNKSQTNNVSNDNINSDGDLKPNGLSEDSSKNDSKKKKKSKKKRHNSDSEYETKLVIVDSFKAEETVVETPKETEDNATNDSNDDFHSSTSKKKRKKSKRKHSEGTDISIMESPKKKKKKSEHCETSFDKGDEVQDDETDTFINGNKTSESSNKVNRRKTISAFPVAINKSSDRIMFEDDNNSDLDDEMDDSSKYQHFLKLNPKLKPVISNNSSRTLLTEDDEIWIVKCPSEMNVSSLKGKSINLSKKIKISIDNQVYNGAVDKNISSISLVNSKKKNFAIKQLPINGFISLRKRVPRAHYKDDNHMVNNQTDFIPLPDVKCRHPFFGLEYKKAIKVSRNVKEKLKENHSNDVDEEDVPIEVESIKIEGKKKKKKKKKQDEELSDSIISKKNKSIDVWGSAKAIEDSLFNN